jgi:hypothetical protein
LKSNTNMMRINERLKLAYPFDRRVIIGFAIVLLIISPFALTMRSSTIPASKLLAIPPNQSIVSTDVPHVNLTYTTRTLLTDTPVDSGDTIAGDHVTLKATWKPDVNNSRLEVYAPAIPSTLIAEENQTTLEIDTRYLGNNATCTIFASTLLPNGTMMSEQFVDVYIGNFFAPVVRVVSPNGGENWTSLHNITWTASDVNVDDTLLFDVLYSDDSGASFDFLVESTNQTWLEWDCSVLNQEDTYIVEVRATDSIYFSSDRSDNEFSAGLVVTTTTTTTTTTTPTNGSTDIEPRVLAFIAILLISSGVMALVVYYAARKWF